MNYRDKAIHCVKDTILPMQREQFEECGRCLDEQYKRYGNTEWLSAKTIEEGHIYEIGYPACVCPEVASGKVKDASHANVHAKAYCILSGICCPIKISAWKLSKPFWVAQKNVVSR